MAWRLMFQLWTLRRRWQNRRPYMCLGWLRASALVKESFVTCKCCVSITTNHTVMHKDLLCITQRVSSGPEHPLVLKSCGDPFAYLADESPDKSPLSGEPLQSSSREFSDGSHSPFTLENVSPCRSGALSKR
jgi:hypothetical protein